MESQQPWEALTSLLRDFLLRAEELMYEALVQCLLHSSGLQEQELLSGGFQGDVGAMSQCQGQKRRVLDHEATRSAS